MFQDIRYAFRTLRHKPSFALTAIMSTALGVGASALIFSEVDGLLLRPLPLPRASQVVTLRSRAPNGMFGNALGSVSWRDYVDFRDRLRSFSGLIAYQYAAVGYAPDAKTQADLKTVALTSRDFFHVLEVEPQIGRGFLPSEGQIPGRDTVAVLGYEFWKSEFNADRSIIGRTIRLNGLEFRIVGVAPEHFSGMDQYVLPVLFVPASMGPRLSATNPDALTDRNARSFTVKGRLRRGASLASADAEATALAASLERSDPATNRGVGVAIRTEMQTRLESSPGAEIIMSLLSSLVAVVLLISCANVANLILSRGRSRAREIAVRLAIGASRMRLVRQLMTESLVIAFAGGALGLAVVAFFLTTAPSFEIPGDIPVRLSFHLNARLIWFTLALSTASALLFGLAPAFQAAKADLVPSLKSSEGDRARKRFFGRGALVAIQVAGSLVLLVAATQLLRGISRTISADPGFRRDGILLANFDPSMVHYSPAETNRFYRLLVERARDMPGVESGALASQAPLSTSFVHETVIPEGYQFPRGQESVTVWSSAVDENLFGTLGITIVRGRGFLATDQADTPPVCVVNELFARRYLGSNPIGRRLRVGGRWLEVVGVSASGRYFTGTAIEPPSEALFLPFKQHPAERMTLLLHAHGDPAALAVPLRDVVRSLDPNLPVFGVRTMADYFEQRSVKALHLITDAVGGFGLIGLTLALVGLYAVVAWQVAGRTREIGLRIALGADRWQVVKMILRQSAMMSGAGVAIGLVISFAATRVLNKAFPPLDPWLFAVIPVVLLLTTFLAAVIPARRASTVDAMVALRHD